MIDVELELESVLTVLATLRRQPDNRYDCAAFCCSSCGPVHSRRVCTVNSSISYVIRQPTLGPRPILFRRIWFRRTRPISRPMDRWGQQVSTSASLQPICMGSKTQCELAAPEERGSRRLCFIQPSPCLHQVASSGLPQARTGSHSFRTVQGTLARRPKDPRCSQHQGGSSRQPKNHGAGLAKRQGDGIHYLPVCQLSSDSNGRARQAEEGHTSFVRFWRTHSNATQGLQQASR